jgi:hypothetical protein
MRKPTLICVYIVSYHMIYIYICIYICIYIYIYNKGCEIIDNLIYNKISINKKEGKEKNKEMEEMINIKDNEHFKRYLSNELSPTDKYKNDSD